MLVESKITNSGNVYIGDSSAGILAGTYHNLRPGEAHEYQLDDNGADDTLVYMDLSDLWIDGATNGDKVQISYLAEISVNY